jgi:uncharacterized protein YecT (DUF1311 family)
MLRRAPAPEDAHKRRDLMKIASPRFALSLGASLLALVIPPAATEAAGGKWPKHLTLHEDSRSPDGHYGIVVTTSAHVHDGTTILLPEEGENFVDYFADLRKHRLLGQIKDFEYVEDENHAHLEVLWTPDSKVCLAAYWARYGFADIALLEPNGDGFVQMDLGKHIQQAVDRAAKKKASDDNMEVYPKFHFEPGRKMRIQATANNNPKSLEQVKTTYVLFQGTYDVSAHKWLTSSARTITGEENDLLDQNFAQTADSCAVAPEAFKDFPEADEPLERDGKNLFRSADSEYKFLDELLNKAYKTVRLTVSAETFAGVKQEEIAWVAKRDAAKTTVERNGLTQERIKELQKLLR